MDLQGITVVCLRAKDFDPALIAKFSNQKSITVEQADCESCGEVVLAKTKLKLNKVKCSHCV